MPLFLAIPPDNCHAIFAFAVITLISAFASTRYSIPSNSREAIDDMLGVFTLIRDATIVLQASRQRIKLTNTNLSFQPDRIFDLVPLPSDMVEALGRLQQINKEENSSLLLRET